MNVIRTIKEMQAINLQHKKAGKSIGFVPTMGFLHEGHLTLLKKARMENDIVVLSIFVNPLQFGPNEDFDAYPRDIERDEALAKQAGVDYLFYPAVEEMYPQSLTTSLTVRERVNVLCGKSRPGHFDGVVTVVLKLFNIVMPERAYFGLKDAQQVAVISGLVDDYNVPVTIVPVPTVREADGLAKSSRNVYLSAQERDEAAQLFASLLVAKEQIKNGEKNVAAIKEMINRHITSHTSGTVDYIDIYTYPQLNETPEIASTIIIAIAVKFSKARLIDNIII
ncbi:MAG: pantoate--beta-alanine ligase [Bacillaceae bacterium]